MGSNILLTIIKKRVFILAFFFPTLALASGEKINKVQLAKCQKDYCVELSGSKLYKSGLSPMYAFGPSKIQITSSDQKAPLVFEGYEGSFDPDYGRFYLSKESSPFDYVIDTMDRQVYKFPRS